MARLVIASTLVAASLSPTVHETVPVVPRGSVELSGAWRGRVLPAARQQQTDVMTWVAAAASVPVVVDVPKHAQRSAPTRESYDVSGGVRVSSTAYCLTGRMADGQTARRGAVAANRWPLGTRLRVSSSPGVGEVVTVEDRIGSGSELDFALPGDCAGARAWGRQTVTVEVVE